MNFETTFPLRLYINLGFREDRRADLEIEFYTHGFDAERFPAVDARWLKRTGKFSKPGWCALATSLRLLIREAERRGAESVLILEDDVVFHPEFKKRLEEIKLPRDWGIFYLGCQHVSRPDIHGPGIVRCTRAVDMHAVAVHAKYFRAVRKALAHPERISFLATMANDQAIAELQTDIPTYAAFPNLAWQRQGFSNAQEYVYSAYDQCGNQFNADPVTGLLEAMERAFPNFQNLDQ